MQVQVLPESSRAEAEEGDLPVVVVQSSVVLRLPLPPSHLPVLDPLTAVQAIRDSLSATRPLAWDVCHRFASLRQASKPWPSGVFRTIEADSPCVNPVKEL